MQRKKLPGRPPKNDGSQKRTKSVHLSVKANYLLIQENRRRDKIGAPKVNLSEYLSRNIVKDFEVNPAEFIRKRIRSKQKEKEMLEEEIVKEGKLLAQVLQQKEKQKEKMQISMEIMD